MSLGVCQAWRVLRTDVVAQYAVRPSLIPRGSLVSSLSPSIRSRHHSASSSSNPAAPSPRDDPADQNVNGNQQTPSPRRDRTEKNSPPDARRENTTPTLPESRFYTRLAKLPIRRVNPKDNILIKPVTTYPSAGETGHQNQKVHRAAVKQLVLKERRAALKSGGRHGHEEKEEVVDWRITVEVLDLGTEDAGEVGGVSFRIRAPVGGYGITEGGVEVLREAGEREGVEVRVEGAEREGRYVEIEGHPVAARTVVERALRYDARVVIAAVDEEGKEKVVYSGVELLMAKPQNAIVDIEREGIAELVLFTEGKQGVVQELQLPEEWTTEKVERYVAALTCDRLPRGTLREVIQEDHHHMAVAERLVALFSNQEASAVASLDAFKMALVYLNARSPTFLIHVRTIFRKMTGKGFKPDAQVMNILLQGAVQAGDLRTAHKLLQNMLRLNLKTTPRTWILILRLIQNEEVRRFLLFKMNRKGVLEYPGVVAEVAGELAEHDVYRAIQLGQSMESFVATQNRVYGSRWLGHYSANKTLDWFGRYGRFDDMYRIVSLMFASETAKPSAVTVATVMTHCRLLGNVVWPIKYLKLFERNGDKRVGTVALGELFKLLHNRDRLMMLSAVWRYALLHRLTTFHMRRVVKNLHERGISVLQQAATEDSSLSGKQGADEAGAKKPIGDLNGKLGAEDQQRLLRALFPWEDDASLLAAGDGEGAPGSLEGHDTAKSPPTTEETNADPSAIDTILQDIDELHWMVQSRKFTLSRILIKAERRDGQLNDFISGKTDLLGRRTERRFPKLGEEYSLQLAEQQVQGPRTQTYWKLDTPRPLRKHREHLYGPKQGQKKLPLRKIYDGPDVPLDPAQNESRNGDTAEAAVGQQGEEEQLRMKVHHSKSRGRKLRIRFHYHEPPTSQDVIKSAPGGSEWDAIGAVVRQEPQEGHLSSGGMPLTKDRAKKG